MQLYIPGFFVILRYETEYNMSSRNLILLLIVATSVLMSRMAGSRDYAGSSEGRHVPQVPVIEKTGNRISCESEITSTISAPLYFKSIPRRESRTSNPFVHYCGGQTTPADHADISANPRLLNHIFHFRIDRDMLFSRLMRLNI